MNRRTLLGLCTLPAFAADWPQWRGPKRDAISSETGLLKEWPKAGPKLLWQHNDIGDGYATPSVANNRIYLTSTKGLDNEFVQALSLEDGKPVWATRLGKAGNPDMSPSYPKARSTPFVDGSRTYVLGSDGDLVSLETTSGKEIWRKSLRADFGGKPGTWAYAESPLIDGDTLIVTPGGETATIVALNKTTGATIWKSAVPGGDLAAYASAIVAEAAGRKQYIQFLAGGLVGVDAKTGQFLWRYEGTGKGPANIATPIAYKDHVYSTNARRFGGGLVKLTATATGMEAKEIYMVRDMPNTLGGQVLLGEHIYGTNPEGPVCAKFLTGEILWKNEGVGPGAVLYAENRLYFHGENGDMLLVEATPDAYREKGRFTLPAQPKRGVAGGTRDEHAWSYPVVANGRLIIRDLGTLWCYDIRDAQVKTR